jgi:hypothetical protein
MAMIAQQQQWAVFVISAFLPRVLVCTRGFFVFIGDQLGFHMRLLYVLFLFKIILSGCVNNQSINHTTTDVSELLPTEKLELSLDSITSQQTSMEYYFDQKSKRGYFVGRDSRSKRLLFYGEESKKLEFVSQFAAEGPNGIGKMCDFYVHSLDSIFLLDPPQRFYLVDTGGNVRRHFNVRAQVDISNETISTTCAISNQNLLPLRGLNFYFLRWPDGFVTEYAVRKQPFLGQLNLTTGKVKILPAFYPTLYQRHFWSVIHMEAGITQGPQNFVFNFPASDSVYAWQAGKSNAYYAASRYISEPIRPVEKIPTTELERDRPIIEQQCYAGLGYDPWRQVYYRIAWHPHDDLSNVGNILRIYAEKPCSIIILDKDLNIIGETMLPRDRYFTMRWFIGPKGLYISDAHPDNPDLDEDVLSYTLFTLAEKKDG